MFDPYTGKYPITDDWNDHIRRGSAGGIDWAMKVGTPLICPEYARVEYIPYWGTGGHTTKLIYENGDADYLLHNSQFLPGNYVRGPGEVLALSGGARGADGAGNSTGAHLHAHGVTAGGIRRPPFFFGTGSQPAGGGTTPILNTKDDDMKLLREPDYHLIALTGGATGATVLGKQDELPPLAFDALVHAYGAPVDMPTNGYFNAAVAQLQRTAAAGGGGAGGPGWTITPEQFVKLIDDAIDEEKILTLASVLAARPAGATAADIRPAIVSALTSIK